MTHASTHHDEDEADARHDPLGPDGLGEGGLAHARDGVPLLQGRLGRELGPWALLLLLEVQAVPVVGQGRALPLPVLQEGDG